MNFVLKRSSVKSPPQRMSAPVALLMQQCEPHWGIPFASRYTVACVSCTPCDWENAKMNRHNMIFVKVFYKIAFGDEEWLAHSQGGMERRHRD